jgi:6-phospho-beta-glucosidase
VNARILESYKTIDHVPDELKQRGGYGYSRAVANLVKGIVTGDCKIHYAVVKNGSILLELPSDSFVEVPVMTQKNEIKAIQVDPLPETIRTLLITMNQYERMLFTAARDRSLKGLLNALLVHPLIGSYTLAEPLLQDVIKVNCNFLPRFSPLP